MTFEQILDLVRSLLQEKRRVTYGSLKRRFDIDDDYVADVAAELIEAEGVAADEAKRVLVWTGNGKTTVPSTD